MSKYTFSIDCNGQSGKWVLSRKAGESEEHVALKLLAFLLHVDRRPQIEVGVGQHYQPDLVCQSEGKVTLWIECGDVAIRKLDKVTTHNHHAEVIVVKPTQRAMEAYRRQAEKRVRRHQRVRYLSFDDGFLDRLVAALTTRTRLTASLDSERTTLKMTVNGTPLATRVHWCSE